MVATIVFLNPHAAHWALLDSEFLKLLLAQLVSFRPI